MAWPLTFPVQCPPEDASNPEGLLVYCFVANDPPTRCDFMSIAQERPGRSPHPDIEVECRYHGKSVFCELYDLFLLRGAIPKKFKRMKPAEGHLIDGLGVIKHTPSNARRDNDSHHTLWLETASEPEKTFKTINVDWSSWET
jgi:hypothetical protein